MQEQQSDRSGMEIGIYTLADIGPDPHTGETLSARQRTREIIEAARLADEAGLDVFGVGEHHRLDYAVSAPPVVLAAIAQVTHRIRLMSAATVLSTVDPVRLFEDFATLDLVSDGRAEIIAGRGAFIESYPLFGYSTDDYDALFSEHLDLLLKLNESERVTWSGRLRAPLRHAEVAPRPMQERLPIWVGVGGTPSSAARAGRFGTGMVIAMLGGDPARFMPLVDAYRSAGLQAGHKPEDLRIGVTGHAHIARTTQQARDEFYPYYSNYWSYVNRQRGALAFRMTQADYERIVRGQSAADRGENLASTRVVRTSPFHGAARHRRHAVPQSGRRDRAVGRRGRADRSESNKKAMNS